MGGYLGPDLQKGQALRDPKVYTADENQSVFLATYTPGYCDVYQNGRKLRVGVDVTALNGTSVTLKVPATFGDVIEINGQSTSSPYDFYTKAQADLRNGNFYGLATGTGDAMSVALSPSPTSWIDGLEIKLRVVGANYSASPTLTVAGLTGTKTIRISGNRDVFTNAYVADQEITLRYNLAGDRLEIVGGVLAYSGVETALPTSTGSVTLDLSHSNNWSGTLTGNIILANPTTMPVGQSGVIRIVNGATPYTIAYGSYWKAAGGFLPVLTPMAGSTDNLVYYVESATRVVVAVIGDTK